MPSLNLENFGDLVELTLRDYVKTNYVSLLSDLTDHPAAKQLIRKSRMDSQGGDQIEWKVRMGTAESYRHISATTPDLIRQTDDFEGATCPFRKVETGYAFLEEEMDFNAGPQRLIDIIKAKQDGCDFDFIEGIEVDFWAFPNATDPLAFRSLPYWCPKNATTGFNGGIPTGYSDVAGLSPTTFPRWNNYTAQYAAITLDDMIRKGRTMAESTNFKPPVASVPELGAGKTTHGYYTNLNVKQTFEDVADSRNDNLGVDVAKMDNQVMFRGAPLNYVPKLNEDTTDPFYQINWNVFKTLVKRKWWQRRTTLKPVPGQRNQCAVFYDTYMNWVCFNRRLLGVLATGTTYPS